jgi:hypothetical protein
MGTELIHFKICTKCGEEKELSEFYTNYGHLDGYTTQCKQCVQEYRQNNKEKIKEYYKKYCQNNKEKIKEGLKKYRQNNKKYFKEYHKKYCQNNKEKIKEGKRKTALNITDGYIACILRMSPKERQQYPELIKLKRLHIQIQRELKQK